MRGFFKLAFGVSILSLVAVATPACGDDDDDSGGSGGTAATGGGGTGGTTSDAGVTCGTQTCTGWKIKGILPAEPCCPEGTTDKCGAEISATLETAVGLPQGCYEVNQGGTPDCNCESFFFTNPIPPPDEGQFNGCCTPTGECGIYVKLSSLQGPDLERIPRTKLGLPAKTCTVGSETPPPADPDGGTAYCPNPDAGAAGAGGTAGSGSGGTAGAATDAGTD